MAKNTEVPGPVGEAMKAAGATLHSLSDATGIAYSTLRRKLLLRPDDLNLAELVAIAEALGTEPGALLPATFLPAQVA